MGNAPFPSLGPAEVSIQNSQPPETFPEVPILRPRRIHMTLSSPGTHFYIIRQDFCHRGSTVGYRAQMEQVGTGSVSNQLRELSGYMKEVSVPTPMKCR